MPGMITPAMAWSKLMRHAREDIVSLRLSKLVNDSDRVSALVTVHSGSEMASERIQKSCEATGHPQNDIGRILVADLSRQKITLETLNHLLGLASSVDMKGFIQKIAWGQNSLHASYNRPPTTDDSSHFQFDDQQTSPSRSTTSKWTRFSETSDHNPLSDDHTVSSFPYIQTPSANLIKGELQTCPSMHMALRAPCGCDLSMLTATGDNAVVEIQKINTRIQMITNSIRRGEVRGASGQIIQNILVIGKGVAFTACQFVYDALRYDEEGSMGLKYGLPERKMVNTQGRSMRFLSRADPIALHSVLSDWKPELTMVVSLILNGEDSPDLIHLTETLKKWLLQGLKTNSNQYDAIWGKHVLLVTASDTFYHTQSITKTECTFLLPQYARYEAFNTTSAAGVLPIALAFGWKIVQDILYGAHDMDSHFVETNPRHNIPVLLALTDIWNDHFLPTVSPEKSSPGRIVKPQMQSFVSYPLYVASIDAEVCSRMAATRTRDPYKRVGPSGVVIDGGVHSIYDRVHYQGGRPPPCEMIIAMDCQVPNRLNSVNEYAKLLFGKNREDNFSNQDSLMCSIFANADVMAVGSNHRIHDVRSVFSGVRPPHGGTSVGLNTSFDSAFPSPMNLEIESSGGNHPSTLLICTRCDAFTCGQLIALAEHRSMVTARLWDIENPYAFSPVHGSILSLKDERRLMDNLENMFQRLDLVGTLGDDDDDGIAAGYKVSISVKTLLGHYASRICDFKKHIAS